MTTYSGVIKQTADKNAPFLLTVSENETGKIFGTFPASTREEAGDRCISILKILHDYEEKDGKNV